MILKTQQLGKSYLRGQQHVDALKNVQLEIHAGEFMSIMGPSGSGKSTLLHLLGGLDRPTSGGVWIEGRPLHELDDNELSAFRRKKLGFIFQFFNLLPTLTAIENVALPRLLDGEAMSSILPDAKKLLIQMGIESRHDHKPDQLSGGEMQRVAIARALVTNPALILADEPTGNLDSATGKAVLSLLAQMSKERGHTIVMVTHDINAASYGNRLLKLKDGQIDSDQKINRETHPQANFSTT
jgi:putative ABC transport system ATP-binding protein